MRKHKLFEEYYYINFETGEVKVKKKFFLFEKIKSFFSKK